MEPISLHVVADPYDLINDLVGSRNSGLNLIDFVLALDADVSDEGFTIELVVALVKSLMADREEYVEDLAKKALEQTLLPPDEDAERFSKSFATRNYTKEWEEELEHQEILVEVIKFLGKLQ